MRGVTRSKLVNVHGRGTRNIDVTTLKGSGALSCTTTHPRAHKQNEEQNKTHARAPTNLQARMRAFRPALLTRTQADNTEAERCTPVHAAMTSWDLLGICRFGSTRWPTRQQRIGQQIFKNIIRIITDSNPQTPIDKLVKHTTSV